MPTQEERNRKNTNLEKLLDAGFYVGVRHEHRNTDYPGRFMVAANGGYPFVTKDASEGGFCIVGDNLTEMIEEAAETLDTAE